MITRALKDRHLSEEGGTEGPRVVASVPPQPKKCLISTRRNWGLDSQDLELTRSEVSPVPQA